MSLALRYTQLVYKLIFLIGSLLSTEFHGATFTVPRSRHYEQT